MCALAGFLEEPAGWAVGVQKRAQTCQLTEQAMKDTIQDNSDEAVPGHSRL